MVDKVQTGSDTVQTRFQTRSGTIQTARHGSGMVQNASPASRASSIKRLCRESPRLPRETDGVNDVKRQEALQRESPSAAPATRDGRGVNGVNSVKRQEALHKVTKCPRLPRETATASTASSVKRPSRESPSVAPGTQDGRGVNGVNGVKRQEALQGVVQTSGSKAILQHATIFGGLNLHLPAILFSPGHQGLD